MNWRSQLTQKPTHEADCVPCAVDSNPEERRARLTTLAHLPTPLPSTGDILDIGPAGGWTTLRLAERYPNARVIGISLFAEEAAALTALGCDAIVADMHEMPKALYGSAALVYASHILEHSPAPYLALKSLRRCLVPEYGIIAVIMPSEAGYVRLHAGRDPVRIDTFPDHIFNVGCETVIALMRKAGLAFDSYHEIPQMSNGILQYCHRLWLGHRVETNAWRPDNR